MDKISQCSLVGPFNPNFQPHFQIEHTNPCNSILSYIVSFFIINLSILRHQLVHHGFETIGKSWFLNPHNNAKNNCLIKVRGISFIFFQHTPHLTKFKHTFLKSLPTFPI
jgi:hypothetical protein